MTQNFVQWRKSDRHFFEHGDLPTSLTLPQLTEIRKTSMARLLCDSGPRVTQIQPMALLLENEMNKIVSCKRIPGVDLTMWADPKCQKKDDYDTVEAISGNYDYTGFSWGFAEDKK